MEINILDFINPEKISEIVEDELRNEIRSQIRLYGLDRTLTNLTSEYVFKLIESEWEKDGVDFEQTLREKIRNEISDDSYIRYYVFRRRDTWNRTESPAVAILDDECKNSKPLIKEMVEKHIREYPFHELDRDYIGSVIYDVIMEKILGRDDEQNE